jgi:hypothetical protein
VISCVTGRRALQAAPRGRKLFSNGSGGTRTHSISATNPSGRCPSQSGLPLPTEPRCSSVAQGGIRTRNRAGLSRAALPVDVLGHQVVPDGVEPSLSGCEPGVRWTTGLFCFEWTHQESHPNLQRAVLASSCWTSNSQAPLAATCFQDGLLIRPDHFRCLSCGGWSRTNIETFRVSCPTVRRPRRIDSRKLGEKESNLHSLVQSQAAYH